MEKDKVFLVAPATLGGWPVPGSTWSLNGRPKTLHRTKGNALVTVAAIDTSWGRVLVKGTGGPSTYSGPPDVVTADTLTKDSLLELKHVDLGFFTWYWISDFFSNFTELQGPWFGSMMSLAMFLEEHHADIPSASSLPSPNSGEMVDLGLDIPLVEEKLGRFDLDV